VSHRSDSNLGSLAKTVIRGNGEAMRDKAVLAPTAFS
jgi:hypothetical protein